METKCDMIFKELIEHLKDFHSGNSLSLKEFNDLLYLHNKAMKEVRMQTLEWANENMTAFPDEHSTIEKEIETIKKEIETI